MMDVKYQMVEEDFELKSRKTTTPCHSKLLIILSSIIAISLAMLLFLGFQCLHLIHKVAISERSAYGKALAPFPDDEANE